jgi:activator of HSP90 ATPase
MPSIPEKFEALQRKYRVENQTNFVIWWRDQSWTSGELAPGQSRAIDSNHDADITMFGKTGPNKKDEEWGRVWIQRGRTLEVRGKLDWRLKEWPVDNTGAPLDI